MTVLAKSTHNYISTANELEFVIFCIENIADRLHMNPQNIYNLLFKSTMLNEYIVANYDILHTQGKEYIIDDILSAAKEYGIRWE